MIVLLSGCFKGLCRIFNRGKKALCLTSIVIPTPGKAVEVTFENLYLT